MSRIMRDSVNAFDIPVGTPIVAGYVDGIYAWNAAAWNHHPNALHFGISVYASGYDAHCADVETGDFTPENVVDWALWRRSKGAIPYVYMNLSTWPRVINAFNARGVELPLFWVADWDGIAQIFGGSVGKQYANPTFTGGHYDESVMADYLPGLDPAPPAPAPPPVVTPPPPVSTPPADSPPPFQTSPPPVASDIDTTRTAWSSLASFLTQDLPAFVQELLRLLGLYRRTP